MHYALVLMTAAWTAATDPGVETLLPAKTTPVIVETNGMALFSQPLSQSYGTGNQRQYTVPSDVFAPRRGSSEPIIIYPRGFPRKTGTITEGESIISSGGAQDGSDNKARPINGADNYSNSGSSESGQEGETKTEDEPKAEESEPAGPARVFPDHWLEKMYDKWGEWKKAHHLPVTVGAWHWMHVNNGGPSATDYGIPGLQGTYYWYILADPEIDLGEGGFIRKIGGHLDYRLRENDKFRNFFGSSFWSWELYGYVDTPIGKFKGGQIWKRFGLDWDGTFWGNVPYFDGFKLDPDYGLSWENTWKVQERFTVDSFAQFFFHEDGINGSIAGADPESVVGSNERSTGVLRLVPTWEFHDESKLALGCSGLVGRIENDARVPVGDQAVAAWAVDLTYSKKKIKLFAEYLQSYGTLNPARYVSQAPSNRVNNLLCGIHYTEGPATFRFSYSAGWDENPNGRQDLFVPGLTVALTKNIDFYAEYVRWNVHGSVTPFTEFEDGFQFIVHWRY